MSFRIFTVRPRRPPDIRLQSLAKAPPFLDGSLITFVDGFITDNENKLMSDVNKITWDEVVTAQAASRKLLTIANAHSPRIGMGALIMATSLAAREMNIPAKTVAAMFDQIVAQIDASGYVHPAKTIN